MARRFAVLQLLAGLFAQVLQLVEAALPEAAALSGKCLGPNWCCQSWRSRREMQQQPRSTAPAEIQPVP